MCDLSRLRLRSAPAETVRTLEAELSDARRQVESLKASLLTSDRFQADLAVAREQLRELREDVAASQRRAFKESGSLSDRLETAEVGFFGHHLIIELWKRLQRYDSKPC